MPLLKYNDFPIFLAVILAIVLVYATPAGTEENNVYYGFLVGCGDISHNSGIDGLHGCEVDLHYGEVLFLHEENTTSDILKQLSNPAHALGTPVVLYYKVVEMPQGGQDSIFIYNVTVHDSPPWL